MKQTKYVCLEDFRKLAKTKLDAGNYNYLQSGAEEEITKNRNQQAFFDLVVMPRVLRDISEVDLSVQIFGKLCALPFGFTAWAANKLVHQSGQLFPSMVCAQNKMCYILSTLSNTHPQSIYKHNKLSHQQQFPNPNFLQLYLSSEQSMNNKLIELAEQAHFDGICITVDTQILGIRNKQMSQKPDFQNIDFPILQELRKVGNWTQNSSDSNKQEILHDRYRTMRDLGLTWEKIGKIKKQTKLKIILKGIMHPEDALKAVDYCDVIYISNHGGRQLDTVPSTIQTLPKIMAALNQLPKSVAKPKIFIDGGIRGGLDIFKCLALGADYVFVGRPVAYALCDGEHGVTSLMNILREQLTRAMILSGVGCIKDINSSYLRFRTKL